MELEEDSGKYNWILKTTFPHPSFPPGPSSVSSSLCMVQGGREWGLWSVLAHSMWFQLLLLPQEENALQSFPVETWCPSHRKQSCMNFASQCASLLQAAILPVMDLSNVASVSHGVLWVWSAAPAWRPPWADKIFLHHWSGRAARAWPAISPRAEEEWLLQHVSLPPSSLNLLTWLSLWLSLSCPALLQTKRAPKTKGPCATGFALLKVSQRHWLSLSRLEECLTWSQRSFLKLLTVATPGAPSPPKKQPPQTQTQHTGVLRVCLLSERCVLWINSYSDLLGQS